MSITAETRREAYMSAKLTVMEQKVYDALKEGPLSVEQIMDKLGVKNRNCVAPRLTGLSKKGVVKAIGKRHNEGGKREAIWEITA